MKLVQLEVVGQSFDVLYELRPVFARGAGLIRRAVAAVIMSDDPETRVYQRLDDPIEVAETNFSLDDVIIHSSWLPNFDTRLPEGTVAWCTSVGFHQAWLECLSHSWVGIRGV